MRRIYFIIQSEKKQNQYIEEQLKGFFIIEIDISPTFSYIHTYEYVFL